MSNTCAPSLFVPGQEPGLGPISTNEWMTSPRCVCSFDEKKENSKWSLWNQCYGINSLLYIEKTGNFIQKLKILNRKWFYTG